MLSISWKSHAPQREGLATMRRVAAKRPKSLVCTSEIREQSATRVHVCEIWSTGSFLPTLASSSCVQTVSGTPGWVTARGLGGGG